MRPDELIPVSCSLDYISLQYTTFTPVYTLYLTSAGEKETAKIEIWKCEIWNPPRFSWDSTFDLEPLFTRKKFHFFTFYSKNRRQFFFWSSWRGPPKHSDLHFLDLTPWPMGKGVLRPLHPSRRLLIHSIE